MKTKKIDVLRVVLILMLLGSLITYYKLNKYEEKMTKLGDLPKTITNLTWYSYDDDSTISFESGKITSSGAIFNSLKKCNHYDYYKDEKTIRFDCKNVKFILKKYSNNRMILNFDEGKSSKKMTFYSSKELVDYVRDNKLSGISDKELDKIVNEYSYESNRKSISDEYKNSQISKLSSMSELSVDEFINYNQKEDRVVLVLNSNMAVDSYDIIPLYIYWSTLYNDYDFYYINGENISSNDYSILNENEDLSKYITGNYDSTIIIFKDGEYKVVDFDINLDIDRIKDKPFSCNDSDCLDLDYVLYIKDKEFDSLDELLKK